MTPFETAQQLRQFEAALQADDPVAVEIRAAGPLPKIAAAAWLQRIKAGTPKCDYPTPAQQPPCTAEARFAVSAPPEPDTVKIVCGQHLNHLTKHGLHAVAPLLHEFDPARTRGLKVADPRRLAARLQQARRLLPHHPERAAEIQADIINLQAEIFPLDPVFHAAAKAAQPRRTELP